MRNLIQTVLVASAALFWLTGFWLTGPVLAKPGRIEIALIGEPWRHEFIVLLGLQKDNPIAIKRSIFPLADQRYWIFQLADPRFCIESRCRTILFDGKEKVKNAEFLASDIVVIRSYKAFGHEYTAVKFDTPCGRLVALLNMNVVEEPKQFVSIGADSLETRPLSSFQCPESRN